MEDKKYISITGTDYTEHIKTSEDKALFEELVETEARTVDVPLKECIYDVIKALKIDRILRGGDPDSIVIAKSAAEGLAKIQAFSKPTQN